MHVKKIIDLSLSFKSRDQLYRLLTVRFAFQILNDKDQSNQVETPLPSPKIRLPKVRHTSQQRACFAAKLAPSPLLTHALVQLTEGSWLKLMPSL